MQVERLGELCSRPSLRDPKLSTHPIPFYAEIDVLLKMLASGGGWVPMKSPIVGAACTSTADENVVEPFNQVAIVEVMHCMHLCSLAAEYKHPIALSNNRSMEIIYKFVQLERGLKALMQYYGVMLDSVFGVAIILPSFQKAH
ncbi:hypothetical protein GOP47_0020120 [Adiantum capillus-veneris]|uniref:Uncharacterized protein n=1 Tax=Adiantum capillus-veneris TaxID=13818 RepID=A0A9D4Z948_ADICA|nr:hypothetical protein GOP47_0020120 [Adiantum capillus-veneris]